MVRKFALSLALAAVALLGLVDVASATHVRVGALFVPAASADCSSGAIAAGIQVQQTYVAPAIVLQPAASAYVPPVVVHETPVFVRSRGFRTRGAFRGVRSVARGVGRAVARVARRR